MAVAEILQNQTVGQEARVYNPQLVLRAASGVIEEAETTSESGKKSSRPLLTSQAPTLQPSSDSRGTYLDQLVQYMNEILDALVVLTQQQSKLNDAQTKLSDQFVQLGQIELDKAAHDLKKYIKAVKKAKKFHAFGKIGSIISGVLLCVVGIFSGDPALILGGVFMVSYTQSGGAAAVDDSLSHLSPGLKALALIGITAAFAVALAGAGGAVVEAFGSEAAEASAEEAAAQATEEAGDAAASQSESSASTEAAEASQEQAPSSYLGRVFKAGFKDGKIPFGNYLKTFVQTSAVTDPYTPLAQSFVGLLRKMGIPISQNTGDDIATYLGAVLSIAANFSSVLLAEDAQTGLVEKFKGAMGENRLHTLKRLVQALTSLTFAASGLASVLEGKQILKQADVREENGKTQSVFSLYQALLDMSNSMAQKDLQSFKSISDIFTAINNRWSLYTEPYAYAAEILG